MTLQLRLCCDGHRHGQPCRGALNIPTLDMTEGGCLALHAGWRVLGGGGGHCCPSHGHDEEEDET